MQERGEEAPVQQPFAEKTIERGQRGHRENPGKQHQGGARHPRRQPAQGFHVAGAGGVQHRARTVEQQALEHGVIPDMEDGPAKTMLGSAQKAWFLERLKKSTATFKIVATSVPFHGSSADAWGNYKTERDEVAAFIKSERISHVVMISADYHFAREWSNKRTGIYEFMAGPLASFRTFEKSPSARERHSKGPHFVFGDDFNFALLAYDGKQNSLTVSYRDSTGKQLFETLIAVA